MIYLELYKPKKEILDLEDEVIELWYGKSAIEFIRKIIKCEVVIDNYISKTEIKYVMNGNLICYYKLNVKEVWLVDNYFFTEVEEQVKQLIKDLFNYEIKNIY